MYGWLISPRSLDMSFIVHVILSGSISLANMVLIAHHKRKRTIQIYLIDVEPNTNGTRNTIAS